MHEIFNHRQHQNQIGMTRPYLNILNWAYLSTVYGKLSAQPGYMAATFSMPDRNTSFQVYLRLNNGHAVEAIRLSDQTTDNFKRPHSAVISLIFLRLSNLPLALFELFHVKCHLSQVHVVSINVIHYVVQSWRIPKIGAKMNIVSCIIPSPLN